MLYTIDKIADLTNGTWENLDKNLNINEFHHTYHYLQKGDAFVIISDNWPNGNAYKNNENKIKSAIKKGISAIIATFDVEIDEDIPILRVENSYFAIKKLAKYASQKTEAKKVLISGSYGKTGFKLHLNHIIKNQKNIYLRKNSANYTASSYCNLASIKEDDELFLMEIPVANRDKMIRRVKLIDPDMAVLTSIGHEGIERFKTINRIIRYKLLIASALPKNGKLLLPYDDRYYDKIYKEAKKYNDIEILTYGSSSKCNANVLYKKYSNFGWDVIAKIENKVVAYKVPFMEEYSVSNSLGVLLCAFHLGLDVHESANEYYNCRNFKSSGLMYGVELNDKNFYLYNQCNRGGIEGYESFFKTLSYLKPKRKGKKILITSEFVDYIDGEMDNIDEKLFQKLIKNSGITDLFSVEKFSEHINVLEDKSIWKNHSIDYNNIKDEIFNTIQDDDIVSVKGIFDCSLTSFMKDLNAIEDIKIKEVNFKNNMEDTNNSLRNLRTIEPSDVEDFKKYVQKEDKRGWVYFFPFIYFWSLSSSREILIDKKNNTLSLFLLDKFHKSSFPKFQQYIPTLPLLKDEQLKSIERIYKYKGRKTANIVWIDKEDVSRLKSIYKSFQFKYKTSEYLYNPKLYNDLGGKKFRNLRQQLTQMSKNENTQTVPYEKKYEKQCLELHDLWNKTQIKKYGSVSDEKYTRNCILNFDLFTPNELNGLVILQNNKVISFGFVGYINTNVLSFFIGKSDYSFNGVQSYLKYTLLKNNEDYLYANDGPSIAKGLDASKRMFRPVSKHKVYKGIIK